MWQPTKRRKRWVVGCGLKVLFVRGIVQNPECHKHLQHGGNHRIDSFALRRHNNVKQDENGEYLRHKGCPKDGRFESVLHGMLLSVVTDFATSEISTSLIIS